MNKKLIDAFTILGLALLAGMGLVGGYRAIKNKI